VATPDKASDKIVRLFRVLYDNSVSYVRTGETHTSGFKMEAGFPQVCVLARGPVFICHRHGLVAGQDC